eukprot:gene15968-15094_t
MATGALNIALGAVFLVFAPLTAVLGALLAEQEGWNHLDGMLYVGGDITLTFTTSVFPTSDGGKAFAFFISSIGLSIFSLTIAGIGALPFVDRCWRRWRLPAHRPRRDAPPACELLRGKEEAWDNMLSFFTAFLVFALPSMIVLSALPLG